MDTKKPPDPPDPFEYTPVLTVSLPDDNVLENTMDSESTSRKRVATSPPATITNPPKLQKKEFGRQAYTLRDNPPYIVHVSLKDGQTPGTVLHPVKFGMFLTKNNYSNILLGSVKRLGRNRVSVEFKSHQDANSFLISRTLAQNNFVATIPQFNITRLGLVRDVPSEWTEDEVIENIKVPAGCGPVIKARRMSRKVTSLGVTEWKPTQTVVLTFDGQVLPKRVYCFYSALSVERYMYPTIQCFNCCRFDHTRTVCRSQPRCFKCGQEFKTNQVMDAKLLLTVPFAYLVLAIIMPMIKLVLNWVGRRVLKLSWPRNLFLMRKQVRSFHQCQDHMLKCQELLKNPNQQPIFLNTPVQLPKHQNHTVKRSFSNLNLTPLFHLVTIGRLIKPLLRITPSLLPKTVVPSLWKVLVVLISLKTYLIL